MYKYAYKPLPTVPYLVRDVEHTYTVKTHVPLVDCSTRELLCELDRQNKLGNTFRLPKLIGEIIEELHTREDAKNGGE
jgi:hypothetical protein